MILIQVKARSGPPMETGGEGNAGMITGDHDDLGLLRVCKLYEDIAIGTAVEVTEREQAEALLVVQADGSLAHLETQELTGALLEGMKGVPLRVLVERVERQRKLLGKDGVTQPPAHTRGATGDEAS